VIRQPASGILRVAPSADSAVPTGLGSCSGPTQDSAFGSVLGYHLRRPARRDLVRQPRSLLPHQTSAVPTGLGIIHRAYPALPRWALDCCALRAGAVPTGLDFIIGPVPSASALGYRLLRPSGWCRPYGTRLLFWAYPGLRLRLRPGLSSWPSRKAGLGSAASIALAPPNVCRPYGTRLHYWPRTQRFRAGL